MRRVLETTESCVHTLVLLMLVSPPSRFLGLHGPHRWLRDVFQKRIRILDPGAEQNGFRGSSLTLNSSKHARAGSGAPARIRATLLLVSATVSEQI